MKSEINCIKTNLETDVDCYFRSTVLDLLDLCNASLFPFVLLCANHKNEFVLI